MLVPIPMLNFYIFTKSQDILIKMQWKKMSSFFFTTSEEATTPLVDYFNLTYDNNIDILLQNRTPPISSWLSVFSSFFLLKIISSTFSSNKNSTETNIRMDRSDWKATHWQHEKIVEAQSDFVLTGESGFFSHRVTNVLALKNSMRGRNADCILQKLLHKLCMRVICTHVLQ